MPTSTPSNAKLATLASQLCPDPANNNDAKLKAYFAPEKADLPHPYLNDPESNFAWEVDDSNREVRLVSKGGGAANKRATQASEDFLGLNREELLRARYAQYSTKLRFSAFW